MFKRKLGLILVLFVLMTSLAGCMQIETGIKINKDGSGGVTMMASYNIDMLGDEEGELNLKEELSDLEGIDVEIEPVKYTDKGFNFVGEKASLKVDNIEEFLTTNEDIASDGLTITDLGNGVKRIEVVVENDDSEEMGLEGEEFLNMLIATGFKMDYTIEVEGTVIDSNATSSEGNVYKWDLLKLAEDNPTANSYLLYLEYSNDGNVFVSPKADGLRGEVEKELGFLLTDKDFHGKALNKLGILKGTDKGLELDKSLTRAEGAVMYSRLLGLEGKIEEFAKSNPDYTTPFSDIPTWVKPTINYLYSEGLIKGINETQYGSNDPMTESQYATLVLRALGYKDGVDFNWDSANKRMVELGFFEDDLVDYSRVLGGDFNRRKMSYISYNALFMKDISGLELYHRIK